MAGVRDARRSAGRSAGIRDLQPLRAAGLAMGRSPCRCDLSPIKRRAIYNDSFGCDGPV